MSEYLMRYVAEDGKEDTDLDHKESDITFQAPNDSAAWAKSKELAEGNRKYSLYQRVGVLQRKKA